MPSRVSLPRYGYLGAAQSYGSGRNAMWRPTGGGARGRNDMVNISPKTLDELEDWMNQFSYSIERLRWGMGALTMILARVNHAESLARAAGPYDPYRRRQKYAWKVPVRRISQRYYFGWKVKKIGAGVWAVYNESREAYYIEFGIHQGKARVRRPVRKLALISTLRWAERSRIYHRIWDDVFQPRRHGANGSQYAGVASQSPAMNMGGFMGGTF